MGFESAEAMPGRYLKGAARSCAGKARFDSAAEAVELTEGKYRSYRCAVCGSWHLTSHGGPVAPASMLRCGATKAR